MRFFEFFIEAATSVNSCLKVSRIMPLWVCLFICLNSPHNLLSCFLPSFSLSFLSLLLSSCPVLLPSSQFHLYFTICIKVTKQGMEMAAEGALLVSSNLGSCAIDPTFTAQVEQRVVKEVYTCCFHILL